MDTTALVVFLGGGSLVATLIVQALKKTLTGVSVKYGALVTQLLLLVISVAVAVIMWLFQWLPANFIANSAVIFAGAMALYEIGYTAIIKNIILSK